MHEISPLPDFPEELKEAARTNKLVLFIGAGVSMLAGAPSWDDFANKALESVLSDSFNHSHFQQIKHLSPKIKLALAQAHQSTHGSIDFEKILEPKDKKYGNKIYDLIVQLGSSFVTTNYDTFLDNRFIPQNEKEHIDGSDPQLKTKPLWDKREFTPDNLANKQVIHIHGSVKDPENMILTTKHYASHYENDRRKNNSDKENNVLTLLDHLFRHKSVLFLGYGLEEMEIIEYVVQKSGRIGQKESKHFIVQGFFSHELDLVKHLSSYYKEELNITLLAFSKDTRNWRQLEKVLERFSEQCPKITTENLTDVENMEAYLDADQ